MIYLLRADNFKAEKFSRLYRANEIFSCAFQTDNLCVTKIVNVTVMNKGLSRIMQNYNL